MFTVLSAAVFVVGAVIFVSVLSAAGGKVPSVFGYSIMQVQTDSMEPELMTGTVIITKRVNTETIKTGDIISFYMTSGRLEGNVNTHRVVEISRLPGGAPVFVTKGDNNEDVDPDSVYSSTVVGKVVCNLGVVSGSVVSVIQNPKVVFFVIVLPLIFITFGEAVNLVNLVIDYKKENNNEELGLEQSSEEKD